MSNIIPDDLLMIGFKEVEDSGGNYFQRGDQKIKFERKYSRNLNSDIIKTAYLEWLSHYILPNYSLEKLEKEIEGKRME